MLKKEELSRKIVTVLFEFMAASELEWDQTYFRLAQFNAGHIRAEWVYRLGKEIKFFPKFLSDRQAACREIMELLVEKLFDDAVDNGLLRPVVVVANITAEKKYQMDFAYDSNAMQISKLYLGLENSFFGSEVDVPNSVIEYRKELEAKGVTEIPSLIPRK